MNLSTHVTMSIFKRFFISVEDFKEINSLFQSQYITLYLFITWKSFFSTCLKLIIHRNFWPSSQNQNITKSNTILKRILYWIMWKADGLNMKVTDEGKNGIWQEYKGLSWGGIKWIFFFSFFDKQHGFFACFDLVSDLAGFMDLICKEKYISSSLLISLSDGHPCPGGSIILDSSLLKLIHCRQIIPLSEASEPGHTMKVSSLFFCN